MENGEVGNDCLIETISSGLSDIF